MAIQDIYKAVEKEQGRLLNMQGQFERLQENKASLETLTEWMDRAIEVLGPLESSAALTVGTGEHAIVQHLQRRPDVHQVRLRWDGPRPGLAEIVGPTGVQRPVIRREV